MKKTVLAVLMVVMVVTPCLAQEVEPSEIFSLHGTAWDSTAIISIVLPPQLPIGESFDLGFYGRKVYMGPLSRSAPNPFSCYIDLLVASFYVDWRGSSMSSGILLPNGKGTSIVIGYMILIPFIAFQIHELNLEDDNWTPPEPEPEVE